jgi:glycosyltransferase involved in cell wall biosynthesis
MGYQENHLARIQASEGHSVMVVTGSSLTPWGISSFSSVCEEDQKWTQAGIEIKRLPILFECSHRVLLKGIKKILQNFQPDWVHVHGYATLNALLCAVFKKTLPFKLLIDDHMLFSGGKNRFARVLNGIFKYTASRFLQNNADRLVAVSEETKTFMIQMYGVSAEKIEIIPLGVDRSLFFPSSQHRQSFRKKFNISEEEVLILYTGKINPDKNPLFLLEASLPLWKKGLLFRCFFVGNKNSDYMKKMEKFIAKNKIDSFVHIHESVPAKQLAPFFNMADIAVWPVQSSMSSLEAMSCGCPVILSRSPANIERTSLGSGSLFSPGNLFELSNCLEKLIENATLRKEMGQKGILHTETLDWKRIAQKFLPA